MFPMGGYPVDKKSLQFMCAWNLIRYVEDSSLEAIEVWKINELEKLNQPYQPSMEGKLLAKVRKEKEAVEKQYNAKRRKIRQTREQKEIKLMRRVAGSLAKI